MQKPVQIFPSTYRSNSDVFASRERAAYRIGRPDGASMACFNISEREAHEIVTNLPDELLEKVKEHYKLGSLDIPVIVTPEVPENAVILANIQEPEFVDPADDWLDEKPAPETETEKEDSDVDLQTLSLVDLKELAKELNISGVSKYKAEQKDELINLIENELKKIDDVNDEDEL